MLSVRSPWGAWGDGTVAAVDPVGLLLETAMTPEQWMPIADAVQTFDERSLTMVQARLDATNDVSRRMEAQQRMMQSSERPNQQTQQYLAQKMQEAWLKPSYGFATTRIWSILPPPESSTDQ